VARGHGDSSSYPAAPMLRATFLAACQPSVPLATHDNPYEASQEPRDSGVHRW
jgi:hypothetical protein